MKRLVILGLVFVMLIPLLVAGCGGGDKTITLAFDDFGTQTVNYQLISLKIGNTLTITLESNATTGYSWEEALISAPPVVEQFSHNYVEPTSDLMGASGSEVWVFNGITAGAGTITFNYSQPWEGGDKNAYTVYVIITVE